MLQPLTLGFKVQGSRFKVQGSRLGFGVEGRRLSRLKAACRITSIGSTTDLEGVASGMASSTGCGMTGCGMPGGQLTVPPFALTNVGADVGALQSPSIPLRADVGADVGASCCGYPGRGPGGRHGGARGI